MQRGGFLSSRVGFPYPTTLYRIKIYERYTGMMAVLINYMYPRVFFLFVFPSLYHGRGHMYLSPTTVNVSLVSLELGIVYMSDVAITSLTVDLLAFALLLPRGESKKSSLGSLL